MDLSAAMASVNYWAVTAAALVSFLLGGLWYSPAMFHRSWMQAAGVSDAQMQSGGAGVFAAAFVLQWFAAFVLALFLGSQANFAFGVVAGLLVGVAWVATAFAVVYLFERRPLRLFWINAGYQIVLYTIMGGVLGAWR